MPGFSNLFEPRSTSELGSVPRSGRFVFLQPKFGPNGRSNRRSCWAATGGSSFGLNVVSRLIEQDGGGRNRLALRWKRIGGLFRGGRSSPPDSFSTPRRHTTLLKACPDVRCSRQYFQHFDSDKMFRNNNNNRPLIIKTICSACSWHSLEHSQPSQHSVHTGSAAYAKCATQFRSSS